MQIAFDDHLTNASHPFILVFVHYVDGLKHKYIAKVIDVYFAFHKNEGKDLQINLRLNIIYFIFIYVINLRYRKQLLVYKTACNFNVYYHVNKTTRA